MKILKYILVTVNFLILGHVFAQTPTEIKDIINKYTSVTLVESASVVYVTSAADFKPGDTVMIAQMRGAIYSPDDPSVIDNPAKTGKYELTVIGSVSGTKITFNSPLKNTYDSDEVLQLIRVPSYSDAKVVAKLTCGAWDGQKGGVLVLVATSSLTLDADIDVSGKGFRGQMPVTYATGKCFATSGVPFSTYNILNASVDSTSGLKGEGISTKKFVYQRGKGPSGNGGGAGSGAFSGGGGGGNFGFGGKGAKEGCAALNQLSWGGDGGGIDAQYFSNTSFHRRIYLGGGGGSGIERVASAGSAGGNGGGIVIILTPYIVTNNNFIRADGISVTKLVTDGSSSGGGGGGGMVLLAVDSVKNKNLNVSAIGGNGGGTASGSLCEGHGGGGGGGFVWFSGKTMDFSALNIDGGNAGYGTCDVSATAGNKGDSLNRLLLPLTGFLNNTIQTVPKTCYKTSVVIKGSRPQGGNGVYTYLWEYRNYGSPTWTAAPGKNDSIHYKTSLLLDTSEFRRTVSSDGMNDISRLIRVNVFPEITNNIIDPDTTLCVGSPSVKIRGTSAAGGIGGFTYDWTQRTLTGSWEPVSGIGNTKDYTISSDVTRYYRRKASSDYCSTYDSVKVEILPLIANNLVTPRQTICSGAVPVPYMGTTPTGGDNVFKYLWQQSNDSLNWANTVVTTEDFTNPAALTQTTYYRRIVYSGLRDCCSDISKNIKVIVLPQITSNSITAPQTICQGTAPELFNGSTPAGGDIISGYRYKWESTKNNIKWDSIIYSPLNKNYQAPALDTTISFRRVVFSGLNDCCKSISNEIKMTVQPKIKNNTISGDTAICDTATPALVKGLSSFTGGNGSSYASKWIKKGLTGNWQDISGAIQYTYQPPALTDSVSYRRVITSGTCIDSSNIVKIDVLNTIQGNQITGNSVVCQDFEADPITGGALTGGEPMVYRYLWEKSTDQTNWSAISGETNSQLLPGVLPQDLYFRRKVKSGPNDCCISISNSFNIVVDPKPLTPEAGADKDLIYQDTTSLMAVAPPIGTGIWTTTSDASISTPDKNYTKINDLKVGRYVFYWTVTNGVCPTVNDSVVVMVSDLKRYTGFSPNGDGINDYFVVDGITSLPGKKLTIMNRWGVEVYYSSDYQNDWDGKNQKNGEDLPEDTYFYVLRVDNVFDKGNQKTYKGYVVIKR